MLQLNGLREDERLSVNETDLKKAFGKILAEIYDIKNQIAELKKEEKPYSNAIISELNNGIEHIINQEFDFGNDFVLKEERFESMLKDLDDFEINNPQQAENINGFYDLPLELQNKYSRIEWIYGLNSMIAARQFTHLTNMFKNGGENSPTEFTRLGEF